MLGVPLRKRKASSAKWMGPTLEGEGIAVSLPAGGGGVEAGPEVAANVEVAASRAAEEPFDGAAGGEVEVQGADVDGEDAGGLVEIGDCKGADLMSAVGDGGEVLDEGGAEGDVRDADQPGLVVDGGEDGFEGDGDAVGGGDRDDAGALAR